MLSPWGIAFLSPWMYFFSSSCVFVCERIDYAAWKWDGARGTFTKTRPPTFNPMPSLKLSAKSANENVTLNLRHLWLFHARPASGHTVDITHVIGRKYSVGNCTDLSNRSNDFELWAGAPMDASGRLMVHDVSEEKYATAASLESYCI